MDLSLLEELLQKYQLIITILLIPLLGIIWTIIKVIYSTIKENQKELIINYTAGSSVENPNYCFSSIEITNHKSHKIIADKLELIVYDDENEYILDLLNERFIVESENIFKKELQEVSHYICNDEYVDFRLLMYSKQYYFNIYNNKKLIYSNKKRKFRLKKILKFQIKPYTAIFENVVHSFDWEYGIRYTYNDKQYIGFMNRRQLQCRHAFTDVISNDYFTPEIVNRLLQDRGCKDIEIKNLSKATNEYRHIEPRKLGNIPRECMKGTLENPITISDKDILSIEIHEENF